MERKRKILIALLVLVFLVSGGMIVRQQLQYRQMIADSDEAALVAGLQSSAVLEPSHPVPSRQPDEQEEPSEPPPEEPSEPLPEEPSEPLPEEAAALTDIDLEALRAINEDVVGWIEIPGTELSYPLLQWEDNQYYLNHNWKKQPSSGGSVFLECTSNRDLTDYHTIVYAHRMRNDSMFGTLKYYNDLAFWQEHPCVYLMTETGVHRYEIFAAQETGTRGIVYRLDIEESGMEAEFLRYCTEESVIDTGITPATEERILTLSTCTSSGESTKRWVVHAVLRGIWTIE